MSRRKRGIKRDCGNCDKVYGFSSDMPPLADQDNDENGTIWGIQGEPFGGVSNGPGTPKIHSGSTWTVNAAKVPTSYPHAGCDDRPPMSSADPTTPEHEQWSAEIAIAAQIDVLQQEDDDAANDINNWHFVWWSRAVAVDGSQRHIYYGINGWWTGDTPSTPPDLTAAYFPTAVDGTLSHDIVRVNISDTSDVVTYSTAFLGHKSAELNHAYDPVANPDLFDFPASEMDRQYYFMGYETFTAARPDIGLNTATGNADGQNVYAAQTHYVGLNYYFRSTYSPDLTLVDGSARWQVARLQLNSEAPTTPTCYCSDAWVGQDHVGTYAIALPSVRAFLQSSVEFDEPRVCAIKVEVNPDYDSETDPRTHLTTGLVTGLALNTRTRTTSHVTQDGDNHLVWDGTLNDDDDNVDLNTILPPEDGPYAEQEWNDLRIRCYVHYYGKDYLLFTTKDKTDPTVTFTPLAIFGADGVGNLNQGLEDAELLFTVEVESTDEILTVNDSYYTDAPDWTMTDPTEWAAEFDSSPSVVGRVSLILEDVEVVNDESTISFDPRLDNRAHSLDDPDIRLNIPATDGTPDNNSDTLEFYDNGILRWSTWNADATDATPFLNYYSQNHSGDFVTVGGITPGKHKFRWTLKRYTSLNDLQCFIRRIQLPECLGGVDPNAVTAWFVGGDNIVRKMTYRKWPKRDDEQRTDLLSRYSTVPDFIMPDKQGRVLMMNAHYVTRVIVDGIDNEANPDGVLDTTFFDEGFFVCTASPVIPEAAKRLNGNCEWVDAIPAPIDAINDPKWGGPQMMVTNSGIQLRGMNGSLRDATVDSLGIDRYEGVVIAAGKIVTGGFDSVVLDDNASTVDGHYDRKFLWITSGNGANQHTHITSSLGDGTLTLRPLLTISPKAGDSYQIRTWPEDFGTFLTANGGQGWNRRIHGWTLKHDNHAIPHLEIIWRITVDRPSYPYPPTYDNPDDANGPWPIDGRMEADSSVLAVTSPSSTQVTGTHPTTRIRDPRSPEFTRKISGEPDTRKPVWSSLNKIVSRVYGDTGSRRPQFHWARPLAYYFPDPIEGDPLPSGPWPSVQWFLTYSYHCPSVGNTIDHRYGIASGAECVNSPEDEEPDPDDWHYTYDDNLFLSGSVFGGLPDFDAVDCNCDCCVHNDMTDEIRSIYNIDLSGEAKIVSVYTDSDPGTYTGPVFGDPVRIIVVFNKPVTVVGNNVNNPSLLLNSGSGAGSDNADYDSALASNRLLFLFNAYILGEGETGHAQDPLDYRDAGSLLFFRGEPGAIIDAATQRPANLKLPEPGSENDLLTTAGIVIA